VWHVSPSEIGERQTCDRRWDAQRVQVAERGQYGGLGMDRWPSTMRSAGKAAAEKALFRKWGFRPTSCRPRSRGRNMLAKSLRFLTGCRRRRHRPWGNGCRSFSPARADTERTRIASCASPC